MWEHLWVWGGVPPQNPTWYNFYGVSLQSDDGPHVGPKHVVVGTLIILIIEVNIVVFACLVF